MRIAPLTRARPKPFALLTPKKYGLRVETLDGSYNYTTRRAVEYGLEKLAKVACYVTRNVERMREVTDSRDWTLDTWGDRPASITHHVTRMKVVSLRGTLDDSSDPFGDLARVLAWLDEHGVAPGGLSAMSWNLWRSSLSRELSLGADPNLGSSSFYGGRQSIPHTGSFYEQKLVDMNAAYPSTMAARPMAQSLIEVSHETYLDPEVSGLARATVVVPTTLPYSPLPTRLGPEAIQFQSGPLNGVWPWGELAFARDHGCDVVVRQAWAPTRELDLFTNWWVIGQEGRRLPGASSRLAKAILNCLWGQYAMEARLRRQVTWTNAHGTTWITREIDSHPLPHRYLRFLASEITSRVRVALHTALFEVSVGDLIASHIDTDGFIIARRAPRPSNYGKGFGQFRIKEQMAEVQIQAPQLYRFTRHVEPDWSAERNKLSGRPWHYVASGMTAIEASELFRRGRRRTTIDYLGQPDATLPDGESLRWRENEEWVRELGAIR